MWSISKQVRKGGEKKRRHTKKAAMRKRSMRKNEEENIGEAGGKGSRTGARDIKRERKGTEKERWVERNGKRPKCWQGGSVCERLKRKLNMAGVQKEVERDE